MKFLVCLIALFPFASYCFNNATPGRQDPTRKEMQEGYYIVIGAYSSRKEVYAQRYVDKVTKMGYAADYGFNSKKNYYFVYLDYTENYRESIAEMRKARKIGQFHDAWVFVCLGGTSRKNGHEKPVAESKEVEGQTGQPEVETVEKGKGVNAQVTSPGEPAEDKKTIEERKVIDEKEGKTIKKETKDEEILIEDESKTKNIESLADVSVFFNLVNARNRHDVEGEVQIIDAERSKLLEVHKGGDYVQLHDPNNGTGDLILICNVFGFRKTQKEINYYHPLEDTVSQDVDLLSDIYLVNFPLVRYHVGDIVTMYNVYFFQNASIMRPESKYEVNSLLEMLKENPDYKIRIHGHTNGNGPGRIISQGDSEFFFALDDVNNKDGFGSAKELSEQRAGVIRDYLISEGIVADRMETKAWGGKRMLYNKFSTQAKENVRVEIEILEE